MSSINLYPTSSQSYQVLDSTDDVYSSLNDTAQPSRALYIVDAIIAVILGLGVCIGLGIIFPFLPFIAIGIVVLAMYIGMAIYFTYRVCKGTQRTKANTIVLAIFDSIYIIIFIGIMVPTCMMFYSGYIDTGVNGCYDSCGISIAMFWLCLIFDLLTIVQIVLTTIMAVRSKRKCC